MATDLKNNSALSVEQITQLVKLIKSKEVLVSKLNKKILDQLTPNVITAFLEVLQLPPNNVTWYDVQLDKDGETIILSFQLVYTKDQANTFVRNAFGYEDEDDEHVRIVNFGLPTYYAFADKNDVKQFILQSTESDESDIDHVGEVEDVSLFNTSELDPTQLAQLNLFNKKGTVH